MLCLRDGDLERGSGIQGGTRDWIGRGTNEKGNQA